MEFRYDIGGHVNSDQVSGHGGGFINSGGLSEMEVHFDKLATGWDPRTIVLMCCSRAFAMSAEEQGSAKNLMTLSNGYLTIGHHLHKVYRRAVLRDENGNICADIEASSETNLHNSTKLDSSRIEGGFSHLHPGINGIAEIFPFSGVMIQAGPKVVNVLVNYKVRTEDNKLLHGFTLYPHYLPSQVAELDAPQLFKVEVLNQVFENNRLYVKTRASVSLLEEIVPVTSAVLPL